MRNIQLALLLFGSVVAAQSTPCLFSQWSPCSKSCSGGIQTRTSNGVAACATVPMQQACNTGPCLSECTSCDWYTRYARLAPYGTPLKQVKMSISNPSDGDPSTVTLCGLADSIIGGQSTEVTHCLRPMPECPSDPTEVLAGVTPKPSHVCFTRTTSFYSIRSKQEEETYAYQLKNSMNPDQPCAQGYQQCAVVRKCMFTAGWQEDDHVCQCTANTRCKAGQVCDAASDSCYLPIYVREFGPGYPMEFLQYSWEEDKTNTTFVEIESLDRYKDPNCVNATQKCIQDPNCDAVQMTNNTIVQMQPQDKALGFKCVLFGIRSLYVTEKPKACEVTPLGFSPNEEWDSSWVFVSTTQCPQFFPSKNVDYPQWPENDYVDGNNNANDATTVKGYLNNQTCDRFQCPAHYRKKSDAHSKHCQPNCNLDKDWNNKNPPANHFPANNGVESQWDEQLYKDNTAACCEENQQCTQSACADGNSLKPAAYPRIFMKVEGDGHVVDQILHPLLRCDGQCDTTSTKTDSDRCCEANQVCENNFECPSELGYIAKSGAKCDGHCAWGALTNTFAWVRDVNQCCERNSKPPYIRSLGKGHFIGNATNPKAFIHAPDSQEFLQLSSSKACQIACARQHLVGKCDGYEYSAPLPAHPEFVHCQLLVKNPEFTKPDPFCNDAYFHTTTVGHEVVLMSPWDCSCAYSPNWSSCTVSCGGGHRYKTGATCPREVISEPCNTQACTQNQCYNQQVCTDGESCQALTMAEGNTGATNTACQKCNSGYLWWPCDLANACGCRKPVSRVCVAVAGNSQGATDASCAICSSAVNAPWWPCEPKDRDVLCKCTTEPQPSVCSTLNSNEGNWKPWGQCTKSCGHGTQSRELTDAAKAQYSQCPSTQTRACNTQACPGQHKCGDQYCGAGQQCGAKLAVQSTNTGVTSAQCSLCNLSDDNAKLWPCNTGLCECQTWNPTDSCTNKADYPDVNCANCVMSLNYQPWSACGNRATLERQCTCSVAVPF